MIKLAFVAVLCVVVSTMLARSRGAVSLLLAAVGLVAACYAVFVLSVLIHVH